LEVKAVQFDGYVRLRSRIHAHPHAAGNERCTESENNCVAASFRI